MKSVEIRAELVRALRLDAIGPDPGEPEENEALPQSPQEWYLTGFLVPYQAKAEDRQDPTSTEDVDEGGTPGGGDDPPDQDKPSARRAFLPSSLGLSVLVPAKARLVKATVTWGDYRLVKPEEEPSAQGEGEPNAAGTEGAGESVAPDGSERVGPGGGLPGAPLGGQPDVERGGQPSGPGAGQPRRRTYWQRTPRSVDAEVSLEAGTGVHGPSRRGRPAAGHVGPRGAGRRGHRQRGESPRAAGHARPRRVPREPPRAGRRRAEGGGDGLPGRARPAVRRGLRPSAQSQRPRLGGMGREGRRPAVPRLLRVGGRPQRGDAGGARPGRVVPRGDDDVGADSGGGEGRAPCAPGHRAVHGGPGGDGLRRRRAALGRRSGRAVPILDRGPALAGARFRSAG